MKNLIWYIVLVVLLAGCKTAATETTSADHQGMGMGMGSGMMERHHAQIPDPYAGLSNPVTADDASLERGAKAFAVQCASCHGDGGMGDGSVSAALDPVPAPIAHTSQMMGDDYLFWRISEGGVPFGSAMPIWKDTLDEQTRWDVINYVRALGQGTVKPASEMGGAMYDPQVQATQQAAMLAQAVEQGVLTQQEADIFNTVHTAVEQYRTEHPEIASTGSSATERQTAMLAELVKANTITQEQADAFGDIHDRLGASGLMP